MIVKYCPRCPGRPYTKRQEAKECPVCRSSLASELVADSSLVGRKEISFSDMESGFGAGFGFGFDSWNPVEEKTGFGIDEGKGFGGFGGASSGHHDSETFGESSTWDIDDGIFGVPLEGIVPSGQQEIVEAKPLSSFLEIPPANSQFAEPNEGRSIRGRVFNYSNTEIEGGSYRRLPHAKIVDAIVYGQRTEDLLHRFTVRSEAGSSLDSAYFDVMVNVHGTINGGMRIADNEMVEVAGKYRNGILMARSIDVITGVGKTSVKFQRSVGAILNAFLTVLVLVFGLYLLANHGESIAENIVPFIATWVICAIVLGVLYMGVFSKMGAITQYLMIKHGKVPVLGILLTSLLLTLILLNSFGIGATVGGALTAILAAILPIAIVGFVIVLLLKTIIHP